MNPWTFRKVSPRFWTGTTGRQIKAMGHEAQVIAMYLLTCPSSDMSGLYYLPLPTLAHECGSTLEGACKVLRKLRDIGFASYDEASEQVFVVEMARIQMGEKLTVTDKKKLGLVKFLETCNSPFLQQFFDRYQGTYELPGSILEGASKGLPRSIDTETETEIEIKTDIESEIRKPEQAQAPSPKPPKPKPEKPKPERFVPDSFQPNESHHAKARELGVMLERELQSFRCHEFRVPKTDWNRAFHGWLARSAQYGTSSGARTLSPEERKAEADWVEYVYGKGEDPVKAEVVP